MPFFTTYAIGRLDSGYLPDAPLHNILWYSPQCGRVLSRLLTCFEIGSLSRDVFKRCTSTGSEPFSLLICLDVACEQQTLFRSSLLTTGNASAVHRLALTLPNVFC